MYIVPIDEKIKIGDATIMRGPFRNFAGEKEGKYDQKGKRYFNIQFDEEENKELLLDLNYNVKINRPRDPEDDVTYRLAINIKPNNPSFPCDVYMVCNGVTTRLHPEDFRQLDTAEIIKADLTVRIWEYEENAYSAQLVEGFFTIQPLSYWADKYAVEEYPHE